MQTWQGPDGLAVFDLDEGFEPWLEIVGPFVIPSFCVISADWGVVAVLFCAPLESQTPNSWFVAFIKNDCIKMIVSSL